MADRICHVRIRLSCPAVETLLVIYILLRSACDAHHRLESLYRELPGSCLTGKHDRTCAVINRIGNIRGLRSGRTRILHHGIKHLCCNDNLLACLVYLIDDHFLYDRYFLLWKLHTHVASGDHDRIGFTNDLIDIGNALGILNLGDNIDIGAAIGI